VLTSREARLARVSVSGGPRPRPGLRVLRGLWAQPGGRWGLCLVAVMFTVALGVRGDPAQMGVGAPLGPPTWAHLFGTDEFGRDILSRTAQGLRISLGVSLGAVTAGGAVGIACGLIAGYSRGVWDAVVSRLADVLLPYPPILVGIALTAVLGAGAWSVAAAIALVSFPLFMRVARAVSLVEQSREYVEAARALGANALRILGGHLLPNVLPPLLTQFTVSIAYAVILESGLSFLGVGVQPPQASLGSLLSTARSYLGQAPTYAVFPGAVIAALLLGLNLLSDTMRTVLDPRSLPKGAR